jgi:hypothetical protein
VTVQVFTATRHHHGREILERWFQDRVQIIALSSSPREAMTRDYMTRVISEIHENVLKISPVSRMIFLMSGHPLFNTIAFHAIRTRLEGRPFLILVYDGISNYEAYSSQYVSGETLLPTQAP